MDERSIGAALRAAREAQGRSVEDVAATTRMRPALLTALERGELERLGSAFYARSFVREVAEAVGLDPAPLLEALRADEDGASLRRVPGTPQAVEDMAGPSRPPSRLAGAAAILAIIGLLVAVDARWSPPEPTTVSVPVVPTERIQPVALDRNTTPAPSPGPTAPAPVDGVTLHLEVEGAASWLRVVVDGEVVVEGLQDPGTVLELTAEQAIVIRAGNAGAVVVHDGGSGPAPLGGSGAVVERSWSAAAS
jgi:cytoskeleton protein RodZ